MIPETTLDQISHAIRHEITQLFCRVDQRLAAAKLFGICSQFLCFPGYFFQISLRSTLRPTHQHHVCIKIMLMGFLVFKFPLLQIPLFTDSPFYRFPVLQILESCVYFVLYKKDQLSDARFEICVQRSST